MSAESFAGSIADLPAQLAAAPSTKAEARARYFNSGNAFNLQLPPVHDHIFADEPARALDPHAPTGVIVCDQSRELGCSFLATTPLILARYARVKRGETLETRFNASGVIGYVIAGSGSVDCGTEHLDWNEGDSFVLPGGGMHRYHAKVSDAVLWLVTNEPQLALENLQPPTLGEAPTDIVHFPAPEVTRQIDLLYRFGRNDDTTGNVLIFSSDRQELRRNVLPTLTVAMNSLPAGESQRPHHHNSVAVSLIIQGEGCYSLISGQRRDWSQWATIITPPTAVHSHYNEGEERAMFLIVQDGGFYYHTRTMGFAFD
jgi:quercetin dioxygenase-like cupin family protein